MKNVEWTEADSIKAQKIWKIYQDQHDLSARLGQTAGIDPKTERIWFGHSYVTKGGHF